MSETRADTSEAEIATPRAIAAKAQRTVKPRAAASMVLIDTSRSEPKVLLGRRHSALAFLPGKYVFPGGRLEAGDRLMPALGALRDTCLQRLALHRAKGFPGPQAFALAAIRETFEETGLLLGTLSKGPPAPIPPAWQAFAGHGYAPNLAPLRFIARAITPPAFPRRFDTSFFAVDAREAAHRIEGCITEDTELVELIWLSLGEAAKLDIPRITAMILRELEARIAAGFAHDLPVPLFYERNRRWIREDL